MSLIQLTNNDITIIDEPCTKKQAIEIVAQNMIDAGFVTHDYIAAMFERDKQISTYLGNGIAIPHGTTDKRDCVLHTGLKVLFCRQGINWDEDDNIAYVIIGIAAKANEHLDILRQLTHAVIAEDTLDRIKEANSEQQLLAILLAKD